MGSGGCQHSLLCLNWRGSDRIYSMPANSLSLSPSSSLSLLSLRLSRSLARTQIGSFRRKRERLARTRRYTLASTEVKRWPPVGERVCYSNIMFLYITVTGPITVIIIITIITIWKAGGTWESENKGALRGEKEPRKRDRKMKGRAKGRRRGQRFPSTPVHDLILFCSIETFPGMKICCKK